MATLALLLCGIHTERRLIAQVAAAGQPGASKVQGKLANPAGSGWDWDSAENRWRSQPIDLSAQVDPVPPGLRQRRNAYWSRILAERLSMEKQGVHGLTAEGSPMRLDIVPDPQAIWVVAKFEGYTVVPVDPDYLVMYTEMHFRVERVIQQPKSMSLGLNEAIDVDLIGGRIKTPSGELKSFEVSPRPYSVQPGNTYLMDLTYFNEDSAYGLRLFWKVENGTLTSAYNPRSPFIGHSVDDFASKLKSINPQQ
jgi:hypothetical protein